MKVELAHDYLVQFGGAERVVATWAAHWGDSPVHTLAYDPERTFESLQHRDVRARISNSEMCQRLELMLPILPVLSRSINVGLESDVVLASSSGFAHIFQFHAPTVVYFHSPARWLYAEGDYRRALPQHKKIGLKVLRRYLLAADKPNRKSRVLLVANSQITRSRIRAAYGLEAQVVHPPVTPLALGARAQLPRGIPDDFVLCVARVRGYKNVELATEAARLARMHLIVVGSGSESLPPNDDRTALGRVSDPELKALYGKARCVVLAANEDFGLTGPEANFENTPCAAIPAGGYLETVKDGMNGVLARDQTPKALAEAITECVKSEWRQCREWARANFSASTHLDRMEQCMRDHLSGR